jgi:pilus assembly protein CpaC
MGLSMRSRARVAALGLLLAPVVIAPAAEAQQVLTQAERVISIPRGKSALVTQRERIQRVSVADPEIAEPVVVSPRELLVNGRQIGITSVIVWSETGAVSLYSVEITADPEIIERQIRMLGPDVDIRVTASGNTVILTGTVARPTLARRAVEIAQASGAQVISNIQGPTAAQVLLRVRFAEVSRSATEAFGTIFQTLNPHRLEPGADATDWRVDTFAEGLVRLFLLGDNASLDAIIEAVRARGEFRSLAEPTLLALEGEEASFLAGGEFPFPIVQGATGAVTVTWREFGIRLTFVPHITNQGGIRLRVAPEVSSLDFANALVLQGFRIPALLTRKAETSVELQQGQHLAIAGLLDNRTLENVSKIPLLGDLPILGTFFRSRNRDQNRTELLVIISPEIVQPQAAPPPLPTGEPETWEWQRGLRPQDVPPRQRPAGW